MGPIWGRQDPGGPHVGPMEFAIWEASIGISTGLLLNEPLGTNYSDIWIKLQQFHPRKGVWNVVYKLSYILFRPQVVNVH